uniref:uncharacterized protein LOC120341392 n=1 Tax=Styela clava TaxID=7725 RepID=UPI00193A31F4|nr:uncharacterized protein LOC120341392 [Styela clava]
MLRTKISLTVRIFASIVLLGHCVRSNKDINEKEDTLHVYKIEDYDFENTKIKKICLVAQFNATLEITRRIDKEQLVYYSVPIPQYGDTTGSFCNKNFNSEFKLKFSKGSIDMNFYRKTKPIADYTETTYCDHCDYGTWNLSRLSAMAEVDSGYTIQASLVPETLRNYAKELTDGIDIKRAFKCEESDRITVIPLDVINVFNSSNHNQHIDPKMWHVNLKFYFIQVQPFLVRYGHFFDPYLCRSITGSLMLIIILPLIYFFVFILFYRIKAAHGCPPSCCSKNDGKKHLSSESEICMEEESTNIMSNDYSTIQFGLTSMDSSVAY